MSKTILSKERIIECTKRLRVPNDELVVVGGAALQLFGIKKTHDIDVVVSQSAFTSMVVEERTGRRTGGNMHSLLGRASSRGDLITHPIWDWSADYYNPVTVGRVSVLPPPNDRYYQASFDELRDEAVFIDGVPVAPPQRILSWKQALGRDKDIADIQLIEASLTVNQSA